MGGKMKLKTADMKTYQKDYRIRNYEKQRERQKSPEYKAKRKIRYRILHPNSKPRIKKYANEKEARKENKKKSYKLRKEFVENYKKDKCCLSCGYKKHTEILQFHHLKEKEENISGMYKKSLERIKAEINKCVLLCPNCHSLLHSKRDKGGVDFINEALIEEYRKK